MQQALSAMLPMLCAAEDPSNCLTLFLQAPDLAHINKSVFLPWDWISSSDCRTIQQDMYHPRTVLRILQYITIYRFVTRLGIILQTTMTKERILPGRIPEL